jgi:hypothetical protein
MHIDSSHLTWHSKATESVNGVTSICYISKAVCPRKMKFGGLLGIQAPLNMFRSVQKSHGISLAP